MRWDRGCGTTTLPLSAGVVVVLVGVVVVLVGVVVVPVGVVVVPVGVVVVPGAGVTPVGGVAMGVVPVVGVVVVPVFVVPVGVVLVGVVAGPVVTGAVCPTPGAADGRPVVGVEPGGSTVGSVWFCVRPVGVAFTLGGVWIDANGDLLAGLVVDLGSGAGLTAAPLAGIVLFATGFSCTGLV